MPASDDDPQVKDAPPGGESAPDFEIREQMEEVADIASAVAVEEPPQAESPDSAESAPKGVEQDDLVSAEIREALPYGEELMTLFMRLIERSGVQVRRFLDLGCGDATMSSLILKAYPDSSGVLIDVDEPSLERAWGRLGASADKLAFVAQDIREDEWVESVRNIAPFDLIVTGYVINQQRDDHKVSIYGDIYDLLGPGGLFLNLDFVSNSAPFARLVFDDLYIESIMKLRAQNGGDASREAAEKAYKDWPDRPLLNPSQTDLQCDWLREIGFVGVDCYFRALGVALLGGVKPRKPADA
jgi:SAM-dependent methyltransferase